MQRLGVSGARLGVERLIRSSAILVYVKIKSYIVVFD